MTLKIGLEICLIKHIRASTRILYSDIIDRSAVTTFVTPTTLIGEISWFSSSMYFVPSSNLDAMTLVSLPPAGLLPELLA